MTYDRETRDDVLEAERLFDLGYRQISSRYGTLARVEVPDLVAALREKLPFSSVEKWGERESQDHWRRCYSKDRVEGVPENVMAMIRRMADIKAGCVKRAMVCVNNLGMKEWFDEGIEYVVVDARGGSIWAYDRLGTIRRCEAERFEEVRDGLQV